MPLRRGPALTLIGALSVHGLGAVQLLQGALNQRSFAFYVAYCLAPTLRPGDVLVLDNLPVHHLTGLREWLAKRGVELVFLPPYSPDFNPIELAFSKLKTWLRTAQAESVARSARLEERIDQLGQLIQQLQAAPRSPKPPAPAAPHRSGTAATAPRAARRPSPPARRWRLQWSRVAVV
ncbi:transposase, partial [Georgenia daeguensis]|uniref:transposase n=1 Tax=Georgenia daeguensis TaxID=908355 RepID=UPI003CD0B261